jgi:phytoene desaturase
MDVELQRELVSPRMRRNRRVVIVGAGPGGLAASMLLAYAGADVTVLERLPRVGGRSGTLAANGFRFDKGATFFCTRKS